MVGAGDTVTFAVGAYVTVVEFVVGTYVSQVVGSHVVGSLVVGAGDTVGAGAGETVEFAASVVFVS